MLDLELLKDSMGRIRQFVLYSEDSVHKRQSVLNELGGWDEAWNEWAGRYEDLLDENDRHEPLAPETKQGINMLMSVCGLERQECGDAGPHYKPSTFFKRLRKMTL